jgi:hypothetical protein
MEMMSDLIVCIEWLGPACGCRHLKLCGVVVDCIECAGGRFEVTVLFLSGDQVSPGAFRHLPN